MRTRLVALGVVAALACNRPASYESTGLVVSVDAAQQHVTLQHEDIPGLMGPMTMRFQVSGDTRGHVVLWDVADVSPARRSAGSGSAP